jgi:CNT family concentrative nucleoside transporter
MMQPTSSSEGTVPTGPAGPPDVPSAPPPASALAALPPTPFSWRVGIGAAVFGVAALAYLLHWLGILTPRGQAAYGIAVMVGVVALFSVNLRAVNWQTIAWGFALQLLLSLFVLKFRIYGLERIGIPDGYQPGKELFTWIGDVVARFLDFSQRGAEFVFGPLVDRDTLERAFGRGRGFIFAFSALPTIIFVSSFFTVLYHFGVLQLIVRVFARAMVYVMRTSGAESLSAAANVFMGQTEAPLIVKPYVAKMTRSELLALMVGGMATISGGLMAVYIQMGADQVGILATSVMAAPAGLYLSKLLLPEMEEPQTRGQVSDETERPHRNAIDAAAGGASDGLFLALNVAGMLIAFLAFLELVDVSLKALPTGRHLWEWLWPTGSWRTADWVTVQRFLFTLLMYGLAVLILRKPIAWAATRLGLRRAPTDDNSQPAAAQGRRSSKAVAFFLGYLLFLGILDVVFYFLPEELTLKVVFSNVFAPLAFFMGVEAADIDKIADLLGTKLATNEFVAFVDLTNNYADQISPRSYRLATYALTGFANFASIGIQLGGIGAMAPNRRSDLARLGLRALLGGFLATLINASIAGILMG